MKTLTRPVLPSIIKAMATGLVVCNCSGGAHEPSIQISSAPPGKAWTYLTEKAIALSDMVEKGRNEII